LEEEEKEGEEEEGWFKIVIKINTKIRVKPQKVNVKSKNKTNV
jgi:hypothetical protein